MNSCSPHISNTLFETRKRKVVQTLELLPYTLLPFLHAIIERFAMAGEENMIY